MNKNSEEILSLNLKENNNLEIKYFNEKNNNMFKKTPNNRKIRNPSVDLIRLIAMYGIIINHILYRGQGIYKYSKYQRQLKLFHIILFWHNNAFALISGVVGYKTNKYSNLLYLWFYVVFYSVGIHLYFLKFSHNSNIGISLYKEFFPVIFERYWYFTAYFGMYLFVPAINKGISLLTKSELKIMVISILGIFAFWRDFLIPSNDIFHLNSGNSVLWILIVYITGTYIGKYRVDYTGIKKCKFCFICLFTYSFSTFLFYKSINNQIYTGNEYYKRKFVIIINQILTERYDSILKIVQSISITLFLLQIKFNKYLTKIITFLGPLAFGIYLIHNNLNDNNTSF